MSEDDDIPFGEPQPAMRYGVKQSVWRGISRRIIARDGGICRYCGTAASAMQCDHVVPFTRGGTNDDDNLVAACADCNCRKRARTPDEWSAA